MSGIFRGGVPTSIDVKKLMAAFKRFEPGDIIRYEALAAVIDAAPKTPRFVTVVGAWRKRLLAEQNIDTEAVRGEGIRRLFESERARASAGDLRGGMRKIGKSAKRAALIQTEQLTDTEREAANHVRRVADYMLNSARSAVKELAMTFRRTESLPRGR